jgi:hypothetical protein
MDKFGSNDICFSMEGDNAVDTYTHGSWVAYEEGCLSMENEVLAAYNVTQKY